MFHDQVRLTGSGLWEPAANTITFTLGITARPGPARVGPPAEGEREPSSSSTGRTLGSETYGILSNPFLDRSFTTMSYRISRDSASRWRRWSYEEEGNAGNPRRGRACSPHIDRNTTQQRPVRAPRNRIPWAPATRLGVLRLRRVRRARGTARRVRRVSRDRTCGCAGGPRAACACRRTMTSAGRFSAGDAWDRPRDVARLDTSIDVAEAAERPAAVRGEPRDRPRAVRSPSVARLFFGCQCRFVDLVDVFSPATPLPNIVEQRDVVGRSEETRGRVRAAINCSWRPVGRELKHMHARSSLSEGETHGAPRPAGIEGIRSRNWRSVTVLRAGE